MSKLSIKPWFALPDTSPVNHIAIIGAGIAGCAAAWRLSQAGYQVTVFEKNAEVAQGASGNPIGLIEPYLTANHNLVDQFHSAGFVLTRNVLEQLSPQGAEIWHQLDGIAHIAHTPERQQRFQNLLHKRQLPETFARWLNPQQVSTQIGVACEHPALWLPTAGMIDPGAFCRALLGNTDVRCNTAIVALEQQESLWHLRDQHQHSYIASHVIIANANNAKHLQQSKDYPIKAIPGQLSLIAPNDESKNLRHAVCYEGYMTPVIKGQHVVGASYRHDPNDLDISDADHQNQLNYLCQAFPTMADGFKNTRKAARVGVRALTPDHLPLVGPIGEKQWLSQAYAKLQHGASLKRAGYPNAEYLPNLYLNAGFGSRGLSSALLAAEVLYSLISGSALPISEKVYQALHPSRFWVREITRSHRASPL
jgi:tRNA 5-methylaminomethyl-2-thiouridine biosynthesis bifunctional protein